MAGEAGYPHAVQRMIGFLSRFPGVGKRTAERLALALLEWPAEDLRHFGALVAEYRELVRLCSICGNLSDEEVCAICSDPRRDTDVICVVEGAAQIPVFEKSGCFSGRYHVLGGRIAPLDGKGPDDLTIDALRERVGAGGIRELILASSPDVEGEATASYIAEEFSRTDILITRIASGVPVGADLSYADAATLASALGGRRSMR